MQSIEDNIISNPNVKSAVTIIVVSEKKFPASVRVHAFSEARQQDLPLTNKA
jgi:hypothetical protein